ncbi:MAG TPA: hypothetical protein VFQ76_04870 [Longimicrobiaceae bacterium]|nr:hypothetical protein [Longimicrobiaceae bacterium]
MIRRTLLACIAVVCCACQQRRPAEDAARVDTLLIADVQASRLPVSLLCYFPHLASWSEKRLVRDCPAGSRATRSYLPADVAGCWMLADFRGEALPYGPAFTGPVELAATRTERMDELAAEFSGEPPADTSGPRDPFVTSTWRLSAPDSLTITRSHGYGGMVLRFRVRGDRLVGFGVGYTDVVGVGPIDPQVVVGSRVRCPSAPG